jgi:sugar transferase (PEP-CTERM/EpsH1 system associated)
MEPILFLVHRIPFPPNKGDKIVSYHLLRHLAARYRVHLGTFIDNPADAKHVRALDQWCASQCVVRLHPRLARLKSVTAFFTGEPLTLPYYRSAQLRQWVEATIAENNIRKAVVFSAAMAQYAERLPNLAVVLDLVDVDSAKWTQYAERHAWPFSFIYRREGVKLLAVERSAAAQAVATVLITRGEADLFVRLAPECSGRVHVIESGVDTNYFVPHDDRPSPYAAGEAPIVFTGAMDYWPNIDAVSWFAREVLPLLAQQRPEARFYIVGMNPAKAVRALAADARVSVTGIVPDVRPYLQHAAAVVAPLRLARGIQNKVLEAMAMAKAVVVSSAAASGVTAVPGVDFETAGDAEEFCRKVLMVMRSEVGQSMGQHARARIVADYCWERNLSAFEKLLEPDRCGDAAIASTFLNAPFLNAR